MRIDRLDLRAFGAFNAAPPLDFSQGSHGLHLVFGHNEAGKSTTLRGLTHALYGIPVRSDDNFLHPYGKLRIGMHLRNGKDALAFMRRKAATKPLRDYETDSEVIEEARLREFLCGVDQGLFCTLFGLHHADLVRGGQEILEGGGEVGQALFAAGSGLGEVRGVLQALAEEADALFKPSGSKPALNSLFAACKAKEGELKQAVLSTQVWLDREKELRQTEELGRELDAAFKLKDTERQRLERFHQALPLLTQRLECLRALEDLADAPVLRANFSAFWQTAHSGLSAAELRLERLNAKREENVLKREQLRINTGLLAQAESIEALWADLNRFRETRRNCEDVRKELRNLEASVRDLLESLQPGAPLEAAATLRLEPALLRTLQRLCNSREATQAAHEQAARRLAELQSERQRLEAPRKAETLADPRPVQDALKRARQAGGLEESLEEAESEAARLEAEAEKQRARLGAGWTGSLEALESTPAPEAETVARFARQFSELDTEVGQSEKECAHLASEMETTQRKLAQLTRGGELPAETDLETARKVRDTGWALVRTHWEAGKPPGAVADKAAREFAAQQGAPGNLADAFGHAVAQADSVSDTLRTEADRLAAREQHEEALRRLTEQQALAETRLNQAREARAEVEQGWEAVWQPVGITPLPPKEMEAWLRRREKLLELAAKTRESQTAGAKAAAAIQRHREELRAALHALDADTPAETASLAQWLAHAEAAAEDAAEARRKDQTRREALLKLTQETLPAAEQHAAECERTWAAWQAEWSGAMQALGCAEDTTVDTAQETERLYLDLAANWEKLHLQQRRVTDMQTFLDEFAVRARSLCEHIAPDLAALPPEQGVQDLNAQLRDSREQESTRQQLEREFAGLQAELEECADAAQKHRVELEEACREAGVDTVEELPAAEHQANHRQEQEKALASLNTRLSDLAAGETLEHFLASLERQDADGIASDITALSTELDKITEERQQAYQEAAELRVRFQDLDQREDAARAAEALEALRAESTETARQYLCLKAAEIALREAMERYRRENQGTLLHRTGEIFRTLTTGSFRELRSDFGGDGRQVLLSVREHGETVPVSGMSEGTRDQLYLALRLASIEHYAAQGKPLPFIVDDILVNFDDPRAAAALRVLADLSETVQVIFFTHHRHLVDLARETVDGGRLFVQELARS